MKEIMEVILDALLDSLKVLALVIVIYIILSFVEDKIAKSKKLSKENKLAPLIGASLGLVPQCGMSVVAADMYIASHISMGTIVASFIACSDEAIPILLSGSKSFKDVLMVLLILAIKLVVGFIVGFVLDLIYHEHKEHKESHDVLHNHIEEDTYDEAQIHVGCCHHHIEDNKESRWHKHLLHPLLHSLKIFLYVLAVNLLFGFIVYFVGEDSITDFLKTNRYIAPIISSIVGTIPNCASSVVITSLYLSGGLSIGASVSGLIMNAGLGMVVLLRKKSMWKKTITIFGIMVITSLSVGYVLCLILGF